MTRWPARIGTALGVVLVLLLVYGVLIEPRLILDEERAEVPLPQLGEELAGTEVAVFADLQVGMWFSNDGMVERAVETAVAAEPDAILLGGDFLYSSDPSIEKQIDTLFELIGPLVDSGIPTYAVLGNHDYAIGAADELTTALEDAGIPVLQNEAAPIPGPVTTPPASCTWWGSVRTGRIRWTSMLRSPTCPTARRGWCSCTTRPSSTGCRPAARRSPWPDTPTAGRSPFLAPRTGRTWP